MLDELNDAGASQHDYGFSVDAAGQELIDAWVRLMRLVDRPSEVALLAPMIEREILFRILQGTHGDVLRQIARPDSRLSRIQRALDWIREHYDKPFHLELLAAKTGMNVAALYRHFAAADAVRTSRCRRDRLFRRL